MGRTYDGGYAEYTSVPLSQVIPADTDLPREVLGGLPEMVQTAYSSTAFIPGASTSILRAARARRAAGTPSARSGCSGGGTESPDGRTMEGKPSARTEIAI